MDVLKIEEFLSVGYGNGSGNGRGSSNGTSNGGGDGYGSGFGNGSGYGSGYGRGDGSGDGSGYDYGRGNGRGNGNGDGSGYGYGRGDGSGIKNINGYNVYEVDRVPTIFTHIHGNVARGYMLERNVILKPCYIVKGNGYFAHGETLQEAQSALEEKIIYNIEEEEEV